jgi:hypothetical protein
MRFEVVHEDATALDGDVLALKYAQAPYGLDAHVSELLSKVGVPEDKRTPRPGGFRLLMSPPGVTAERILFIGVDPLWSFGYEQIRLFSKKVMTSLAGELPFARRVLVTIHGPGYGLDENEAFESQLAGFLDAVETADMPQHLETVTFVERNPGRAERLRGALGRLLEGSEVALGETLAASAATPVARDRLLAVGYSSMSKPHIFVAMPFVDNMEDVYHYGISNAAGKANYLCERADLSSFTGDVIAWVKKRIETAAIVVADLTGANPNVYLEVGYAWGAGVPTVLIARNTSDLTFDVQGQRCLVYDKIKDLEEKLSIELSALP